MKIAGLILLSTSMYMWDNEKSLTLSSTGFQRYSILNTKRIGVIDTEGPEKI